MNYKNFRHSRSGFTLVELMIAITIFAIMSTMTIMIYFNISETARRMQISREISETARQITERLSEEIKNPENILLLEVDDTFKNSISLADEEIISFSGATTSYIFYGKKWTTTDSYARCEDADKKNPETHCGLYIAKNGEYYNLVDAFREDDTRKRVKISDLQFLVSGEENGVKKLTVTISLELMKKAGIPNSLIGSTKMRVQTTISSEKF